MHIREDNILNDFFIKYLYTVIYILEGHRVRFIGDVFITIYQSAGRSVTQIGHITAEHIHLSYFCLILTSEVLIKWLMGNPSLYRI